MIGIAFALLAALAYGFSVVLVRKKLEESNFITYIELESLLRIYYNGLRRGTKIGYRRVMKGLAVY